MRRWKRLATNEPMIDPEELTRQENNKANRASHELHQELAALHGAKGSVIILSTRQIINHLSEKFSFFFFLREIFSDNSEKLTENILRHLV